MQMGMRRVLTAAVAGVALGVAVTGCSSGPVEFGTVKPSGDKVKITANTYGNLAPADQWPNACDLLTDDEIESVLPQASVDHGASGIKIIGSEDTQTAPQGQCEYEIGLPGTTNNHPVQVWVDLVAVGDPSMVATRIDHPEATESTATERDTPRKDLGTSLGTQKCLRQGHDGDARWTPYLYCRQGPVGFSINAVVDPKADIKAGGGDAGHTRLFFDKAVKQFPKAIAAKLPKESTY